MRILCHVPEVQDDSRKAAKWKGTKKILCLGAKCLLWECQKPQQKKRLTYLDSFISGPGYDLEEVDLYRQIIRPTAHTWLRTYDLYGSKYDWQNVQVNPSWPAKLISFPRDFFRWLNYLIRKFQELDLLSNCDVGQKLIKIKYNRK